MKTIYLLSFTLIIILASCTKLKNKEENGMRPLYIAKNEFNIVKSQASKPFTKVGKIFKIGNKIYISDVGTGIHVIDNSIPTSPTKEAFISIYGSSDMAVKDLTMYADNGNNLLAIDISNVTNVSVTAKIEDVYENNNQMVPPNFIGPFECVDDSKGYVYDWEEAKLVDPKCKR